MSSPKITHTVFRSILFSIMVLLVGCTLLWSSGGMNNIPIGSQNATDVIRFPTITPPEDNQIASTKTPLPGPTGLPPTWTPLSTYSYEERRQIVMDLYQNNPCGLPCWWGISPGKTDWREAWQFLGRFAINYQPWETLLQESQYLPGYINFRVYLDVPNSPDKANYLALNDLWFIINVNTFKVDYIDVNVGNIADYTFPILLARYGKPEEIYAVGMQSQVSFNSGISILLYYPNHGFISSHFALVENRDWHKPSVTACFQRFSKLFLWDQVQQLGYYERLKISAVDDLTLRLDKPIDQVSDFNVESFYNMFANMQDQPCVEFKTSELLGLP